MRPGSDLTLLRLTVWAVSLWSLTLTARAEEFKGITIPEKMPHGKSHLVLNGTAIRSIWGFKVYVVALYLKETNRDEQAIMQRDDENGKRVHITMLRKVSAKKFRATIQKNIDSNFTNKEKQEFDVELAAFLDCFNDGLELDKHCTVTFDYLPDQGTQITVDGRDANIIPGNDFYHAILRLWIGQPLQASIKEGLVGKAS